MDATQSRMLNINIGILGHVDSGKTSLVKALSTSLSTASLDKSSQSQQRGITLDLGFSAFSMTIPPHLLEEAGDLYDSLQFTLVDCPGHASLIKTIIGGAQIIDMIVLVIDINKGIQTQTAECIVIGEITTEKMIIVLNKVDMIPVDDREERIEKMKNKLRKVFFSTKFADPQFVLTSAAVGGEKVAAVVSSAAGKDTSEGGGGGGGGGAKSGKGGKNAALIHQVDTQGVDTLIATIRSSIRMPKRNYDGPFYFAIDHCFPIKGHGTVLTGTILSGTIQINSTVELPLLQQQRKVKSMQMFRKPVKSARQGDRLGLCVANLDAKLVERGIATTPNSVPLLSTVICLVKKVRFFKFPCKSNTKFHVTIGHTTVNANAVFFGKNEILDQLRKEKEEEKEKEGKEGNREGGKSDGSGGGSVGKNKMTDKGQGQNSNSSQQQQQQQQGSLSASHHSDFPSLHFPWDQDFEYQDELEGAPIGDLTYGNEPFQWVMLQFQQPVYCPLGSLIIGSRLETIEGSEVFGGGSQHCRLAFYGPIITSMAVSSKTRTGTNTIASGGGGNGVANPLEALRLFRWKQKDCDIHRLIDVRGDLCMEAIGYNLYSKEAGHSIRVYLGMKLEKADGSLVGVVHKAFGSSNKFRIRFPHGATGIKAGMKLFLRFKRYVYDSAKMMRQTGMEILVPPGVDDGGGSGWLRKGKDEREGQSDDDVDSDNESDDGNDSDDDDPCSPGKEKTSTDSDTTSSEQGESNNKKPVSSITPTATATSTSQPAASIVKKSIGISLPPASSVPPSTSSSTTTTTTSTSKLLTDKSKTKTMTKAIVKTNPTTVSKPTAVIVTSIAKSNTADKTHPNNNKNNNNNSEKSTIKKQTTTSTTTSKSTSKAAASYAALDLATLGQKRANATPATTPTSIATRAQTSASTPTASLSRHITSSAKHALPQPQPQPLSLPPPSSSSSSASRHGSQTQSQQTQVQIQVSDSNSNGNGKRIPVKTSPPMTWATHLTKNNKNNIHNNSDSNSDGNNSNGHIHSNTNGHSDISGNHSSASSNTSAGNAWQRTPGPSVKPGYQQHILEHMQETNPYLSANTTNADTEEISTSAAPTSTSTSSPPPQQGLAGQSKKQRHPASVPATVPVPVVVSDVSNLSYSYSAQPQTSYPAAPPSIPPSIIIKKSSQTNSKTKNKNQNKNNHHHSIANCDSGSVRTGTVESIKETAEGEYVAIVTGAFRMDENIRVYAGTPAHGMGGGNEVGELLGPFAKMGKCKIRFGDRVGVGVGGDGGGGGGGGVRLPAVKSKVKITLLP